MAPAASHASERTPAESVCPRSVLRGPTAEKPATLQAVNLPVSPEMKANTIAITELVSGVAVML